MILGVSKPLTQDLLSVDPGVEYFAWALWLSGELVSCGLDSDNRYLASRFPRVSTCVCELTQNREGDRKRRKAIDGLIRAAGEIAGQFPVRVYGLQHLPKEVFQARAMSKLTQAETYIIEAQKRRDQFHIKDAIGYGMKYLRRI